ncbi:MAG: hypothetical protein ACRD27_04455 [Terracidiphilus sp.]
MPKDTQLEALLIGENTCILCSIPLLLSRAGFTVDAISSSRILRACRSVRSISYASSLDKLMQLTRERIRTRNKPYDWVIAADDGTLKALCTLEWPSGAAPGFLPVASGGHPGHLYSKIGLSQTLSAGGIQTPDFRVAQTREEAVAFASQLGYPVFAKIDASGGGGGVFECRCDSDLKGLKRQFARGPMLIQKKIAGRELDLSAIYANRELIHFAYSTIDRALARFGPSVVRTYYPLPLVDPKVFEELAALGRVIDAGGFTTISCIEAADGSGRYYIEADMRPNVWTYFPGFYGDDPAPRIRNWFSTGACLTSDSLQPAAPCVPVTMAYFMRLGWDELLINRYRVWRHLPPDGAYLVLRLLLYKFVFDASPLIPEKIRRKLKVMFAVAGLRLT